jgi:cation diffusion facilitator CzcD-associated flavoprotein CzcO
VIAENDLARHIRYRHQVRSASWSSQTNRWTVDAIRTDTGERLRSTASFLWMCQGYYRHAKGYTPEWKDMDRFRGPIVHPQTWPKDLDYRDKNVLVIGSGATAATLVPAIAAETRHTTMLQRSPTYFFPAPNRNELADTLRELEIDESWVHEIVRRKILHDQQAMTKLCIEHGDLAREELLKGVRAFLPEEMVKEHFTPKYRPWQQRLAFVPDGDLFKGIQAGKASVVTDEIERFTEKGVLLKSGRELEADIIVTATGFEISVLGDIAFTIDGKPLNLADTVTYRGMMFTGVPNLLWVFGYFRASWTLRADLLADFVCRLLMHMKQRGAQRVEVALRPEDQGMPLLPWIDPDNFNPGYLMRALHLLPKRGPKPEWQHTQDYWSERKEIPAIDLDGKEFVYG